MHRRRTGVPRLNRAEKPSTRVGGWVWWPNSVVEDAKAKTSRYGPTWEKRFVVAEVCELTSFNHPERPESDYCLRLEHKGGIVRSSMKNLPPSEVYTPLSSSQFLQSTRGTSSILLSFLVARELKLTLLEPHS
ncbi:hypothetical protein Y032_0025g1260 [Ancylostoma ceylanicum]|uniref:Uncharacterized protein n=1 Tax=Ancylostoma ceylanicum TaxID=53326 RepID=A0A016UW53_9BILA|nr:hypothetical protein Y032_0025g1260 [Ancylostoma ceylanicum]